jgi:hypothetical protein
MSDATTLNATSTLAMWHAEDHAPGACEEDSTPSHARPAIRVFSAAILPSTNHEMIPSNNSVTGDRHIDQAYSSGAYDGDTVWFCCCCRDGPHGSWQNVCTNCGNPKCGSCTVEAI